MNGTRWSRVDVSPVGYTLCGDSTGYRNRVSFSLWSMSCWAGRNGVPVATHNNNCLSLHSFFLLCLSLYHSFFRAPSSCSLFFDLLLRFSIPLLYLSLALSLDRGPWTATGAPCAQSTFTASMYVIYLINTRAFIPTLAPLLLLAPMLNVSLSNLRTALSSVTKTANEPLLLRGLSQGRRVGLLCLSWVRASG